MIATPDLVLQRNSGDFFGLAEQRLAYLGRRQQVLAQNIANADTPRYRAQDLPDFASLVSGQHLALAPTEGGQIGGGGVAAALQPEVAAEISPDGNAVNIEQELTKIAGNESSGALVSNLWKSYMGMYLNALGHSGS